MKNHSSFIGICKYQDVGIPLDIIIVVERILQTRISVEFLDTRYIDLPQILSLHIAVYIVKVQGDLMKPY